MAQDDLQTAVREEIEDLHRFFVGWFTGVLPREDEVFEKEFLARLDADFVLIPPAGITLDRASLAGGLKADHGNNPDFRIAIRNVQVRREEGDLVLATYEEWQRDATASTPENNGRVSSVLFRRNDDLRWLHVHETWLPEELMAAGPYDF